MAVRDIFKGGLGFGGYPERAPHPGWQGQYYSGGMERAGPIERPTRNNVSIREMIEIATRCNPIRRAIQVNTEYVFKEGWEWKPKFSKECLSCNEKYPPDAEPEQCSNCEAGHSFTPEGKKMNWFREPDPKPTQEVDDFFKKVDRNGNPLRRVLEMFDFLANAINDAHIIASQAYVQNPKGDIVKAMLREVTVPDPRNFSLVADKRTRVPGGRYWICLNRENECRPGFYYDENTGSFVYKGSPSERPGVCAKCDKKLYPVWYVAHEDGQAEKPTEYYIEREVHHGSKYGASYDYVLSQINAVYFMARSVMAQEEFIFNFYHNDGLPPRWAAFIPTANDTAFRAVYEEGMAKVTTQGGAGMPIFTYDPGQGRIGVDVVSFSKTPEEMQFGPVRDEFYRRIGMAWGVPPALLGNTDAVGLQSQGPTQLAITSLAAETGQRLYNEGLFPWLVTLLLGDDAEWELVLKKPEEEDEMMKWAVKTAEANYAIIMEQAGYPSTSRDQEGHFIFPSQRTIPSMAEMQAQQMSQMDGMGASGAPPGQDPMAAGGGPPNAPGAPGNAPNTPDDPLPEPDDSDDMLPGA